MLLDRDTKAGAFNKLDKLEQNSLYERALEVYIRQARIIVIIV